LANGSSGAPSAETVEVYASTCAACGASLSEAKLKRFRELRDTGAMTDEAFEIAGDVLQGGPLETDGLFLVAARFTAADGTQLDGYVMTSDAGAEAQSAAVLTEAGETVPFWYGIVRPSRTSLEDAYQALGKDASDLFPVRVEALVPTTSGPLVAEINGFGYYDKWPDVHVIT
jgi:hypothetical protein